MVQAISETSPRSRLSQFFAPASRVIPRTFERTQPRMPLPDFCHDQNGLVILAQARANPRDSIHLMVLADWLEGLGDGMAGKFAKIMRRSLETDELLLVNEKYAERLHPLVGFLRGWPHARQIDQKDPVAVAWLSTPDVIPVAPGEFIEMVPVPFDGSTFLISKTVITKRQWYSYLGKKLPAGQNPNHPVTGIPAEKVIRFCSDLAKATGRKVQLPDKKRWMFAAAAGKSPSTGYHHKYSIAIWDSDLLISDSKFGWTRHGTPQKNYRFLPQEVCTKMPGRWGIFDMIGLVTEWCWEENNQAIKEYNAIAFREMRPQLAFRVYYKDAPFKEGIRILVTPE